MGQRSACASALLYCRRAAAPCTDACLHGCMPSGCRCAFSANLLSPTTHRHIDDACHLTARAHARLSSLPRQFVLIGLTWLHALITQAAAAGISASQPPPCSACGQQLDQPTAICCACCAPRASLSAACSLAAARCATSTISCRCEAGQGRQSRRTGGFGRSNRTSTGGLGSSAAH